ALARAYRFRDRLTEVDRLRTAGDYYVEGPGRDRGRGIAAEEEGLRRFPEGSGGYNNLALDLQGRREDARAEALLTRAIALDSSNPLATSSLVRTQLDLGRIDAATTTLATLRRRFPNTPGMYRLEPYVFYATGEVDSSVASLNRLRASQYPDLRAEAATS